MKMPWQSPRGFHLLAMVSLLFSLVSAEEKIAYTLNDNAQRTGAIYTMQTDASNRVRIFDFTHAPKDKEGYIVDLWAYEGKLYFSSNNNYFYGPSRDNLFRIVPPSQHYEKMTPGEYSGIWGSGTATVTGSVERSNGDPYIGTPVFLEGKGMVYTDSTGEFEFQNVASGEYWLTAYRDSSDTHQSLYIHTADNLISGPWKMVPNTGDRWSCESPRVYQNRLYYLYSYYINSEIKYTDFQGTVPHTTVLHYQSAAPQCDADFDAYDVGKQSGNLLFIQYKQGPTCGGIYRADKDGKNITQLVDMTQWSTLNDSPASERQIFWNSEETLFAMSVSIHNPNDYQDYGGILVFDASGTLLSQVYGPASYEMVLYGWDSHNQWLLYALYPNNDSTKKTLGKIAVDSAGIIDTNSATTLLQNVDIGGASWFKEIPHQTTLSIAPIVQYLLD